MRNKFTFDIGRVGENLVPNRTERTSYILSLCLCLLMSVAITFLASKLPSVVPLYFTLPWGEGRLAPKLMLYILPIILLFFVLVNFGLAKIVAKLTPLLPQVLAISTMLIAVMMSIALFGIVQSLIL